MNDAAVYWLALILCSEDFCRVQPMSTPFPDLEACQGVGAMVARFAVERLGVAAMPECVALEAAPQDREDGRPE